MEILRDVTTAAASDVFALPEFATDYSMAGELRPEHGLVDEGGEPANPGFSTTERDLEVRPTVDELERAWKSAPARRVCVVCTVRGGKRFNVQPVIDPVVHHEGGTARIGAMTFQSGRMARWGVTSRGTSLKPEERLRAEKGSRVKPPARDLRHLVQTDAPFGWAVHFHAGTTHSTGRSGAPPECFAEREQARKADDRSLRATLGAHAEILDLAISDATARDIGESRGYRGKHAERRGILLINEAMTALRALVDENNFKKAA